MKFLQVLLISLSYITLSTFVLLFSYIIMESYLFEPPTSWSSVKDNMLYNLGNLYIPAFGMYLHLWSGVIVMLLGLLQILPIIRQSKLMILHRIIGNVICVFSFAVSIGGNIFIYTTGTVGGINMSVSFSIYGWLIFFFALFTYITARNHNIVSHKEWALRLWTMIYSSLFYRLSYYFLFLCGYDMSNPSDFYRPLDEFLDWWFFLLPLFLIECYIRLSKCNTTTIKQEELFPVNSF